MLIILNSASDVCREYMYRGRVESQEVDTLKGVFLAANMLQMTDLELLTVHKLHKLCNLANCLDMSVLLEYFSTCKVKVPVCRYFFVTSYCDLAAHPAIYRKVKRVLAELLAEHWGEMICQTNSNTCRYMSRNVTFHPRFVKCFPVASSRYTQLFQDGIMPTAAQLNNRPTSGIDRLQQVSWDWWTAGHNTRL